MELITRQEAAKRSGLSLASLDRLTSNGRLTKHVIRDRWVRLDADQVAGLTQAVVHPLPKAVDA